MTSKMFLIVSILCAISLSAMAQKHLPIIDMHLHAFSMDDIPPGTPACPGDQNVLIPTIDPGKELDFSEFIQCDNPIFAAKDDTDLRDGTIAALRKHNVRRAMTEGSVDLVADWSKTAGGHLALIACTSDDISNRAAKDPVERVSSKVQAAAVLFPPTNFLNWGQNGFYPVNQKLLLEQYGLLGAFEFKQFDSSKLIYTPIEDEEKIVAIAKSISPAQLVTVDDAPTYIIHGDKDRTVPFQQSELILEKLSAVKVPVVLTIKSGADHGWKNENEDRKEFVKWFDKYLKVQ